MFMRENSTFNIGLWFILFSSHSFYVKESAGDIDIVLIQNHVLLPNFCCAFFIRVCFEQFSFIFGCLFEVKREMKAEANLSVTSLAMQLSIMNWQDNIVSVPLSGCPFDFLCAFMFKPPRQKFCVKFSSFGFYLLCERRGWRSGGWEDKGWDG